MLRKESVNVFQNRMLRKLFGHKREKITEDWTRLHNELHGLYSLPDVIQPIKLWRMRWTGNVTCVAKK
jgi:hypothetical protein